MRKYMFGDHEIIRYSGIYLTPDEIKRYEQKFGPLKWVEHNKQRILAI